MFFFKFSVASGLCELINKDFLTLLFLLFKQQLMVSEKA